MGIRLIFLFVFILSSSVASSGTIYRPNVGFLDAQVESIMAPNFLQKKQEWPPYYYDVAEMTEVSDGDGYEEAFEKVEKKLYRLRIGDKLSISLYGYTEEGETTRIVTVNPTGAIDYLFVNSVPAIGRTIDELRHEMQRRIQDQFPNVVVSVTAVDLFGDQFTIMGEVREPGTLPITGTMTILKAIANAGGFPVRNFRGELIDYADLNRAFLARKGEYVPVDFKRLVRDGDMTQNLTLEGGDYIYIPTILLKEVCVLGEVGRNFVYSYIKPTTLMEVLAWAGGTTEFASHRALVLRGSLCNPIYYLVDWTRISKGCVPDFPLCPGDIVYFPPAKFTTIKSAIRQAIAIFVGAFSIRFAEDTFEKINPGFRRDENGVVIFNPALNAAPAPAPTTIFVP